MKKAVKVGICIGLGLLVACGVCVGLILSNQTHEEEKHNEEYAVVQEWIKKVNTGRGAVEKFLDTEVKSAKLSDEEKLIIQNFEEAVPSDDEVQTNLQKLKDASDDTEIDELADKVALSYIDLRALYLAEKDISVLYDGELSDDDLGQLSKSENKYLATLAKDISDYRTKVNKLNIKDKDFKSKYKALSEEGAKIQKKYAKIELEDLIGKKSEDVVVFFDRLNELDGLLEERK